MGQLQNHHPCCEKTHHPAPHLQERSSSMKQPQKCTKRKVKGFTVCFSDPLQTDQLILYLGNLGSHKQTLRWTNELNTDGHRRKVDPSCCSRDPEQTMGCARHREQHHETSGSCTRLTTALNSTGRLKKGEKRIKKKIQLTNIGLFVGFDDFSQLKISCNYGHLK